MFPCIPLSVIFLAFGSTPSVARSHIQFNDPQPSLAPRANNVNVNPNGSTFLWLPEDTYSGQNFFECGFLYESTQQQGDFALPVAFHFSTTQTQHSECFPCLSYC